MSDESSDPDLAEEWYDPEDDQMLTAHLFFNLQVILILMRLINITSNQMFALFII